jgi:hypothetical protein
LSYESLQARVRAGGTAPGEFNNKARRAFVLRYYSDLDRAKRLHKLCIHRQADLTVLIARGGTQAEFLDERDRCEEILHLLRSCHSEWPTPRELLALGPPAIIERVRALRKAINLTTVKLTAPKVVDGTHRASTTPPEVVANATRDLQRELTFLEESLSSRPWSELETLAGRLHVEGYWEET